MGIEISKRKDGLTIITDSMKYVASITMAIGVRTGSRNETKINNGISHFLEHMAFKGTKKRSAFEIANVIDSVGGNMNAFTSHEKTVYYIKLLAEDVELALDVLSDILQNSIFEESELERERGVILQELHSGKDSPDEMAFDHYSELAFHKQALGRPIIGTEKNIKSFSRTDLMDYIKTQYTAENMVLSVAGNVSHKQICTIADRFLTSLNISKSIKEDSAFYVGGSFEKNKKSLVQAHFCLGFEAPSYMDTHNYYTGQILANILGGGMSSRLFQGVREKLGLCYTISAFLTSFKDTGTFTIYAGTSHETLSQLEDAVRSELHSIAERGVNELEMQKTVNQYKASLLMSLESTSNRAQRAAANILSFEKYISHEEILKNISQITAKDVSNFAEKMLQTNETRVLYGKIKG